MAIPPAACNSAGALLRGAHLERVELMWLTRLDGANLHGAHLQRADLRFAVGLATANLTNAIRDWRTEFPDGFDWRAAGVVSAEGAAGDGPAPAPTEPAPDPNATVRLDPRS